MKKQLFGVMPPIPTPFINDEVDVAALRSNLERWMTTGLHGIVVLGSNGEAPFLTEEESDRVIGASREHVPADRWMIAGTGRETTRATVDASRRAASLGADAVLVRTPAFFKSQMTQDALIDHYVRIADASPVPVLLYNFPALTGVNLTAATVSRLAAHPNISGMKESSEDVAQMAALAAVDGLTVVAGSASVFYPALCVGLAGGILAVANVLPELCLKLFDCFVRHQHDEARSVQRAITPLARLVTTVHGVPGLKAALDMVGYSGGPPRAPLRPVSSKGLQAIREQLQVVRELLTEPQSARDR